MNDQYPEYNKVTDTRVYFYTPRFYALDNFAYFSIEIWGRTFPTPEHAYQWKKFSVSHPGIAEEISCATSAYAAKKISDAHAHELDSEWVNIKLGIMEEILRAKLSQHEKMKRLLLETGDRELFENSPTDSFWGVGPGGDGENHLGKLWMKLRAELV